MTEAKFRVCKNVKFAFGGLGGFLTSTRFSTKQTHPVQPMVQPIQN